MGVLLVNTATVSVANTTTETSFQPTAAYTLPANYLTVGRGIRVLAAGNYTTTLVPPATMNTRAYLGSTVLRAPVNFTPLTTQTGYPWYCELCLVCLSTGATGTVWPSYYFSTVASSTTVYAVQDVTNTGTITIDTTSALSVDLTVQWSAASASNNFQCGIFIIESL